MLIGIVTKNSILLVEYAVMARRKHGMAPIALGIGAEPSSRSPMAIAVIGGLLTSTVLSRLVIPVVFTHVDDLLLLLKRIAGRLHRANHGVVLVG